MVQAMNYMLLRFRNERIQILFQNAFLPNMERTVSKNVNVKMELHVTILVERVPAGLVGEELTAKHHVRLDSMVWNATKAVIVAMEFLVIQKLEFAIAHPENMETNV